MPALSWNEIRQNAIQFSREWKHDTSERAEAQTFWNEFFQVFGIRRRTVATFEEPVKSLKDTHDRIDLFWKGRLLAEHKSAGKDMTKATSQAFQYIQELAASKRNDEIPRHIAICDFVRIVLIDLEPPEGQSGRLEFPLADLHAHIKHFAFLLGQKTHTFAEENEANLKAAAIMAGLHDAIADGRYDHESLERLLVRLLFCLFADDTGIFEPCQFQYYLENRTRPDASDLGAQLNQLFEILNTPEEKRPTHLDEDLAAFPYINGQLFADHLQTAGFTRTMRNHLIAACMFDWSRISPAIFGSLFQGIMDSKERRQAGAHYTSERDILKLIRPLFLDQLTAEFQQIKTDTRASHRHNRLLKFQEKLARLNFLDPACGCGNFLVIAYRELRRLELQVLRLLFDNFDTDQLDAFTSDEQAKLSQVDVNQFYGIEIGEWPARIAETALWLTDHQMNTELSRATGNLFLRIPLKASPHILCANALRTNWNNLLPAEECAFVMGNPPFVGAKEKTSNQRDDLDRVWNRVKGHRILDYVTAWYSMASDYIRNSNIRCAFVSTNSITMGEQVAVLWGELFNRNIHIHFAHRTFAWTSEAKGKAHVHCVIIGFGLEEISPVELFEYSDPKAKPTKSLVSKINPYLIEGVETTAISRSTPISNNVPIMMKGSEATDKGFLLLSLEEKKDLLSMSPELSKFIRPYMGGSEYIKGKPRYCFWLRDFPSHDFRGIPEIMERIEKVREFRLASSKKRTIELAKTPYLFGEIRQPNTDYLLIPKVSSERRDYIPIGFLSFDIIANGSSLIVPNATPWHFGILSSSLHMAWMRQVCGRMKSDYQYSVSIVYNNYPWPQDTTPAQRQKVEACTQAVLDAREVDLQRGATLADLYDPLTMPAPLLKAHQALDRAVDKCYRPQKFNTERERIEYLFQLYEKITSPLAPSATPKKKHRRSTASTKKS